jgi:hypothetical protein
MNDANGGRGQLQGYISDVEFTCGGVGTRTDLWVSQQAPFELLLGRPWQQGNLVTIDEREEGTYLVFKDRETRRPRYELLAISHESSGKSFAYAQAAQSLVYTTGTEVLESIYQQASASKDESNRILKNESEETIQDRLLTLGNRKTKNRENKERHDNLWAKFVYFGIWVATLALGTQLISYYVAYLAVKGESRDEYKATMGPLPTPCLTPFSYAPPWLTLLI